LLKGEEVMENLATSNKEIRRKVKFLKNEFAALNSIYCELREFISSEQEDQISIEIKAFLSEKFEAKNIIDYYIRNSNRLTSTRLEFDILKIIKPQK
jgi:uncharacterized membrane protein YheB (UPF0754 family)